MENRKSVEALHIDREGSGIRTEWAAREFPLTIMLNGEQLVTVLCSPGDFEALAVGFLFSEGIIKAKEEITGLTLDDERGIIRIRTATDKTADGKLFMKRVLTTGCGRGMAFYSYADLDRKKKVLSESAGGPGGCPGLEQRISGRLRALPDHARGPQRGPLRRPEDPGLCGGYREAQRRRQGHRPLPAGRNCRLPTGSWSRAGGSPRRSFSRRRGAAFPFSSPNRPRRTWGSTSPVSWGSH